MDDDAIRVSHADREAAATALRHTIADGLLSLDEFEDSVGLVYAAKTRGDLRAITAGLPALIDDDVLVSAARPAPTPPPAVAPTLVGRLRPIHQSIAIFSGFARRGRWRLPRRHFVLSVFGGGSLDLSEAEIDDGATIDALVVFGGMSVVVPPDVDVVMHGLAIFGARPNSVEPAGVGGRTVVVRGLAVFGAIVARTKRDS